MQTIHVVYRTTARTAFKYNIVRTNNHTFPIFNELGMKFIRVFFVWRDFTQHTCPWWDNVISSDDWHHEQLKKRKQASVDMGPTLPHVLLYFCRKLAIWWIHSQYCGNWWPGALAPGHLSSVATVLMTPAGVSRCLRVNRMHIYC